jgi:chaperonin cofactor prefoldin
MELDEHFNIINDKLQQLLKQYNRVRKENELLKLKLEEQNREKEKAAQDIETLQQQLSILRLSGGDMNEKDKKDFEKQINKYVKEIDKCIAFLSS